MAGPPPESSSALSLTGNSQEYTDEQHAEDSESICIGSSGYKYRLIEGRVMPPYVTQTQYTMSRRVITKSTDICFVAYPKSGSTWLSYILVLLVGSQRHSLRSSVYWLESTWTNPHTQQDLEKAPTPRIFKSHMPYNMALGGTPAENHCRYIYIARNPKDVCVSYYKFEFGKSWSGYYDGNWDHWLRLFLNGHAQYGDWFDHVLSWWNQKDNENILFLKYEDMKRNPGAEVRKIAGFLGIEITDEMLTTISEKTTFEAMRTDSFCGPGKFGEYRDFFRKGEIGSWREYFTSEQSEGFDRLFAERMTGSGLTFDLAM